MWSKFFTTVQTIGVSSHVDVAPFPELDWEVQKETKET